MSFGAPRLHQALRPPAVLACLLVITQLLGGCGRQQSDLPGGSPRSRISRPSSAKAAWDATDKSKGFASSANALGFSLINTLAKDRPTENLIVSPASLEIALAMTYNGAEGKTAEEMAMVLELNGVPIDQVNASAAELLKLLERPGKGSELALADALFCHQGITFRPEFLRANKASYRAEVRTLNLNDPSAVDTIDAWAMDRTRGLIPRIVAPDMLQGELAMVLANAIYFRGEWEKPFEAGGTKDAPFHPPGDSTKTVPMMERTGDMEHLLKPEFEAVRLPYKEKAVRMVILLPKEGSSPATLLKTLSGSRWSALIGEPWAGTGTLLLPRFKADTNQKLNESLKRLGMKLAFQWPGADFSKMADTKSLPQGLFISWVIQQCALEVDEEGTEAAAATHVGMMMGGPRSPEPPFRMVVDRPFVFAIEHVPTGAILFVGAISDPQ